MDWGPPHPEISSGGHWNRVKGKAGDNYLDNYFSFCLVRTIKKLVLTGTSGSIGLFFFFTQFNSVLSPGKVE